MRVGLVAPHIFMHRAILPRVIFSPGHLALELTEGLRASGVDVTLFTPGPVDTKALNITTDLSYFEQELSIRGDTYLDLLKKHPFTFVTLARQVQSELIAKALEMANRDELDVVHIYTNEEDIALPFAALCKKPVVFTHHDPFNFSVKYKNVFPKYPHLNWLSMSLFQRRGMPDDTNWVGNIYHGLAKDRLKPNYRPTGDYAAYLGRIIQPKGVHLAIQAAKQAGVKLKIAGKHYSGSRKDDYWQTEIVPHLGKNVEYVGFIDNDIDRQVFLGNAKALVVPSLFDEPFGMVMIEALACGTPVIGLNSGAIPEVIINNVTGFVVEKQDAAGLAKAFKQTTTVDRHVCRQQFEERFTLERMCREHQAVYSKLCRAAL